MAYSFSSLISLTSEKLANIVLDYQHKFDWGVLRGIDAEVDTENIELCHRLKGKRNKGRVILKLT